MWTTEKIFNRETFEAWLASQPGERGFEYSCSTACALCGFIRETSSAPLLSVGPYSYRLRPDVLNTPTLPRWIVEVIDEGRNIRAMEDLLTIDHIRRAYQKLFGINVCAEYPAIEQPATQPITDAV